MQRCACSLDWASCQHTGCKGEAYFQPASPRFDNQPMPWQGCAGRRLCCIGASILGGAGGLRVIWQPFPVDRANAIRLLKALVAAGANSNTLMVSAWVYGIAQQVSLRGTDLASALAYAEGQGWIADGPQKGWTTITRVGERVARLYVVGL
jgi:hypothetical protein